MKKNTKWLLLVILVFVVWGTQHPPIKILSESIPPFLLNFLRFLIAGVVLLPFVLKQKIVPAKRDLLKIFGLGIIGIALYGFFVVKGIKLSTSTNSAILINSNPLLIAILAPLLIKESMSAKKILGILIGFIGVLLVISNGLNVANIIQSEYFIGNLLLALSALCVAIYAIYNKTFIQKYNGLIVTFYAVLAGTTVLFLLSILNGEISYISDISINSFLLIAYVAIITTAFTWVVWFSAIKRIGVVSTSSFFFLIPISGILSSNLILKEPLTYFTLIGTILILSGIYVVQKQ